MPNAVITHAIRTPIAKASPDKGNFRDVRADDLSADLMKKLVERSRIDPHLVEDVRWGCVQQQGEQGMDIARQAWLIAGLPIETGGVTVNRNCSSSLQAINDAACAIMAGVADVQVAGGVEHMDHIPMSKDYNPSPALFRRHSEAIMQMGLTAEFLALKYRIPRQAQDDFALRSHQGAAAAMDRQNAADEIVPTWGRDEAGNKVEITKDQGVRRDTTKEALAALKPVFNPAGGSVTAGNSSQISVGAAAVLVMSEGRAKELGMKPLARIRGMAVAGVAPEEMGIGPVPSITKALKAAGLKLEDIGAIEINEAFAVQVLSCLKLMGLDEKKVNTRGGAIALGHPIGCSGARISVTLLHRMKDEGARYGVASLCVGQGQGVATVYELCG
jgi:acetyl-CoA acyltransferase